MTAPAHYDITIVKGKDFVETLAFKDAAGAAYNITGWTFTARVRLRAGVGTTYTFAFANRNDAAGTINLRMEDAVTTTIPAGSYEWALDAVDAAGDLRTWLAGHATVLEVV